MYTLRCTQRLLKRLRATPASGGARAPTTTLGDWYANLHHQHRRPWVLAVSERTFLPVILPVADQKAGPLHERFRTAVGEMLRTCGVAPDVRARELDQMRDAPAIDRTASKSTVATLSQFGIQLRFIWDDNPELSPEFMASKLADTPTTSLHNDSPDRATRKLLGGEPDRQLQAEAALHTFGQFRFTRFIEAIRDVEPHLAVGLMAEALDAGYQLERIFFTGDPDGFTLEVDEVADETYRVRFGVVGIATANRGGEWLVEFDDLWHVRRVVRQPATDL